MNPDFLACRGVAEDESGFDHGRARAQADGVTQRLVARIEINDRGRKCHPLAARRIVRGLTGCDWPLLAPLSGSVNDLGEDLLLLQVGGDLLLKVSVVSGGEFGQRWILFERDLLDNDRVVLSQ